MEVLYFEPTDEVTRAIERIRGSASTELALVLPRGSLILQSIVNLKLIQRIATTSKKKLVIVTVDKIGRNLAMQIGMEVYGKVEGGKVLGKVLQKTPQPVTPQALREQIHNETEDLTTVTGIQVHRYDKDKDPLAALTGKELDDTEAAVVLSDKAEPTVTHLRDATGKEQTSARRRLPKNFVKYLVWLLILAALAAGAWLYWFFPKTTVALTLQSEEHQTEATVEAVGKDKAAGQIGLTVTTVEKSGTKTVPATGTKDVGTKATGNVTLVNQYSTNSQSVGAGTLLTLSDGVRFVTTTGVVIPGADITVEGSANTLNKSGRVDVAIVAENPGSQYNVSSGRLTIDGITASKDNKVFAENPATTGGAAETKTIVVAADIENAKNALAGELTNTAVDEVLASLSSGDVIDEATNSAVTAFGTEGNEGDERSDVTVNATVAVNVLAIDQAELKQVIADSVNTQLASDKEFTVAEGGLSYTIKSLNVTNQTLTLAVTAKGRIAAKFDREALQKSLLSSSRRAAESILSQVPFYQSATFTFDPPWFLHRIAPAASSLTLEVK